MDYRCDGTLEELCPVCGDKVSGYHYGLLTCESCKGFFKRTVQNNKTYTCVERQQCRMDKIQRKRCPFCRFQKCLEVGMRLDAVRADRMRGGRNKFGPIYKRDRALKQQKTALIQAHRFGQESRTGSSMHQRDVTFILHDTLLNTNHPSTTSSFVPSVPAAVIQQQDSYSNWTIKSECSDISAASTGFAAGIFIDQHEAYSRVVLTPGPRMPQLMMEFLRCDPDEVQLQKITAHLHQELTGCHLASSTFSHMFVIADQLLRSIVDWARASIFFKQLQVGDQMKLLQHCWSELLVLDFLPRVVLHGKEESLVLVSGQEVYVSDCDAGLALANLTQKGKDLVERLHILRVNRQEFACIKFLILFNPDVKDLEDHGFVESVKEQVEGDLLEYTLSTLFQCPDRFNHLLLFLSELRCLGTLAEDYLYCRHLSSELPCNNLLNEMLHAKNN
ncbi:nuclear receptor subfamily 5 group A member 2-like [Cololabis saira]|uniref:nuclear receptor subfamily 5 group A member 2-like n=1 Tax=Cololabis saira TaxID=129043 RepID=UPI002AD33D63|nr:nuclear receptor subfamily 5 group A member 2-like [Cololabis saira]